LSENRLDIIPFINTAPGDQFASNQRIFSAGEVKPVFGSPVVFKAQPGVNRLALSKCIGMI
jgi:hypothetical protein